MRRTKASACLPLLLAFTALCASSVPRPVAAQEAYACIDGLSDEEVTHRLRYLIDRFEDGKRHARMYWYGRTAFSVGAVALTWTLYGLARDEGRNESDPALMSGIGSILLISQQFAFPLVPAFVPQRLARIPDETPEQRREKLRRATRYLERSAAREDMLRSFTSHAGGFAFGIATGTFIAVRHDEPLATVQAFLAPPLIAEAKVLSVPWNATRSWDRYRSWACPLPYAPHPAEENLDALGASAAPARGEDAVAWSLVPALGGLGVRFDF